MESKTKSGKNCLSWEKVLNEKAMIDLETGEKSLKDLKNYCRNVNNKRYPWCYVAEGEWEYCDIPLCGNYYFIIKNKNISRFSIFIECRSNQFKCNLGACIPLTATCDGNKDCPTGEDEENCSLFIIKTFYFELKIRLFIGGSISCNFDQSYICGYSMIQSDNGYRWFRFNFPTPSPYTGPKEDHTKGNIEGTIKRYR